MKILKRILLKGMPIVLAIFLMTCNLEEETLIDQNDQVEYINSDVCDEILELNYIIETTTRYISNSKSLSNMDIAMMTPKNNKEEINLKLHESGQISMNIRKIVPEINIKIPHKSKSDNNDEITETIIENNVAYFYTSSGKLLHSTPMDLPVYSKTVDELKKLTDTCYTQEDIAMVVARLQSNQIINLEQYMLDTKNNGIQVVQEDKRLAVIRMPLRIIDPLSDDEAVILIDKKLKRLGGIRIYNLNGDLESTTLFGYSHPRKPYLTAIKQQVSEKMPSGAEVIVESLSKIDNINFRLNL